MVESARADPGRHAILATKVSIPSVRPGSLSRCRLIRILDEAVRTHLTLVCTPAGFGKTTLLAGWAHEARVPVAWLSLDEADNDPTRFWRHMAAAIYAARSTTGPERPAPFVDPVGASSEGMAAAISHGLEETTTDLVVVLDDYHAIRA